MSGRREFLKAAVGCAAAIPASWLAPHHAMARPAEPLTAARLTDRLLLISGAGSNVVALLSPDGVLMVDGGLEERSAELAKLISHESGSQPVRLLFNTHWHVEHTGSNERLGKSAAKIIAHENTRLWLCREVFEDWQNRTFPALPPRARPNSTFYTTGALDFGGEHIDYGYLGQAHTDGDIYVFFRKANVLVAGDVVSVGSYPILDYTTGGWIGGMADAAQKLVDLADENTRIIPGSGPIQTRADVAAEQKMLAKVKDDLWQLVRKGMGADDMIAADATHAFDSKWGSPDLFISNAYRGMYGHVRELGGVV